MVIYEWGDVVYSRVVETSVMVERKDQTRRLAGDMTELVMREVRPTSTASGEYVQKLVLNAVSEMIEDDHLREVVVGRFGQVSPP